MERYQHELDLIARIFLVALFIYAGIGKISADGFTNTQQYMEAYNLPGQLLPLVILLELGGGLAVLLGWQTRWAALALAIFTLIAGLVFHSDFTDQMQMIMFMKNLGLSGGFLLLFVHGAGRFSIDAWCAKKCKP